MAAMVAYLLKRPAKCIPHRMEDMRMTGKRNPYTTDYKIGLDKAEHPHTRQSFYQNGAAADLSPAILERTLFMQPIGYAIPYIARNSAFLQNKPASQYGFSGLRRSTEHVRDRAAIDHAAKELGVNRCRFQRQNMLKNGDEFPTADRYRMPGNPLLG